MDQHSKMIKLKVSFKKESVSRIQALFFEVPALSIEQEIDLKQMNHIQNLPKPRTYILNCHRKKRSVFFEWEESVTGRALPMDIQVLPKSHLKM